MKSYGPLFCNIIKVNVDRACLALKMIQNHHKMLLKLCVEIMCYSLSLLKSYDSFVCDTGRN